VELGLAMAGFALAGFVQGVSGFGSGMVVMALLPALWPVSEVVPLSALFSVVLNAGLTWHLRAEFEGREVIPLALGSLVGVPLGVAFLANVDPALVMASLGWILIGFGAWRLMGTRVRQPRFSRSWAPAAGVLSGLTAGAFNVGAPAMLVYAGGRDWKRDAFRGNLQASFFAGGIVLIVSLVVAGLIDALVLERFAYLAPAGALGGLLGARIAKKIPQAIFNTLVLVMVVFMGASYLV
jgi:uncharacterized membrane protein YfcA